MFVATKYDFEKYRDATFKLFLVVIHTELVS